MSFESIMAATTGERGKWGRGRTIFGIEEEILDEYTPGNETSDAAGADGSGDDTAVQEQAADSNSPDASFDKGAEDGGITTEVKENGEVEVEITLDKDVVEAITAKVDDGETPEGEVTQTEPEIAEAAAEAYGACESMYLAISLQDEYVWSKEEADRLAAKDGDNWFIRACKAVARFFRMIGQQILLAIKRVWAFITGQSMKKAAEEILEYESKNPGAIGKGKAKVHVPKLYAGYSKALGILQNIQTKMEGEASKIENLRPTLLNPDVDKTEADLKAIGLDTDDNGKKAELTADGFATAAGNKPVIKVLESIKNKDLKEVKDTVKKMNNSVKTSLKVSKIMEKASTKAFNLNNQGDKNADARKNNSDECSKVIKSLNKSGRLIMRATSAVVGAHVKTMNAAIAIGRNGVATDKKEKAEAKNKK